MTSPHAHAHATPADRRSGTDRRKEDKGPPPGVRERRVSVEPRKPDVHDMPITPSEWDKLTEPTQPMPLER